MAEPRIVHADEWLAVVDKPAGLVVHAGPRARRARPWSTSSATCSRAAADPDRPGIVHRLDKDTCGLMVVARDDEAHRRLAAQIKGREVRRTLPGAGRGASALAHRDDRRPDRPRLPGAERRAVGGRAAREARTHFKVLELLTEDSLVEARLETGRTHQIRAHFAAIGHPLAGDPRYGMRVATAWPASSCTAPGSGSGTR